jgi:hypothetical protein
MEGRSPEKVTSSSLFWAIERTQFASACFIGSRSAPFWVLRFELSPEEAIRNP